MSNSNSTKRHPNFKDLTGQVFHRLTVVSEADGLTRSRKARWVCRCECGNLTEAIGGNLASGRTKSCGCLQAERASITTTTHGGSKSPEYRIFQGMWKRCTNPNSASFSQYKGRTPPNEWKSFEKFLSDMGPRPSPAHSIDRVDNDLPYGPGNCRWATPKEQSRNSRRNVWVRAGGKVMCLSEACEALGLTYSKVLSRFRKLDKTMLESSDGMFDLWLV